MPFNFARRLSAALCAAFVLFGVLPPQYALAQTTGPFVILSFGDSIMWGQGLSETHKFRNIVAAHIRTLTPRPVVTFNYSRSGARIVSAPHGSASADPDLPTVDPQVAEVFLDSAAKGEIPWALPSITRQSANPGGGIDPAQVSLILLNGGADDVGLSPNLPANTILTTDLSVDAAWAARWTKANAVDRMDRLLQDTLTRYPNAYVVVVGYYPPVSCDSGAAFLSQWNALTNAGDALALFTCPPGALNPFPNPGYAGMSSAFFDTSNTGFKASVDRLNPLFGNRAIFAKLDWDPSYSFGASNTLLWQLDENDDVKAARIPVCIADHPSPLSDLDFAVCQTASIGHPNVAGAQFIADTIEAAVEPRICGVLGLKAMRTSMTVTGDPAGVPVVKVTATDAVTGALVAGTVAVHGVPKVRPQLGPGGPTNVSFPTRLQGTAGPSGKISLDREVTASVDVHAPGYCPMMVAIPATTVQSNGTTTSTTPKRMDIVGVPAKAAVGRTTFTPIVTDHGTGRTLTIPVIVRFSLPQNAQALANHPISATLCTTQNCESITFSATGYASKTFVVVPLAGPHGNM